MPCRCDLCPDTLDYFALANENGVLSPDSVSGIGYRVLVKYEGRYYFWYGGPPDPCNSSGPRPYCLGDDVQGPCTGGDSSSVCGGACKSSVRLLKSRSEAVCYLDKCLFSCYRVWAFRDTFWFHLTSPIYISLILATWSGRLAEGGFGGCGASYKVVLASKSTLKEEIAVGKPVEVPIMMSSGPH